MPHGNAYNQAGADTDRPRLLREWLTAAENATRSIQILERGLPDPDAAVHLNRLFVILAAGLARYIAPAKLAPPHRSALQLIDADVLAAIIRLTKALRDHVQANPEETLAILEHSDEWPVVASTDPRRDARRVIKEPGGAAARLYQPISEHLGKKGFFPPVVLRRPAIFHTIAAEAAQIIYPVNLLDAGWRGGGLPGSLDFIDTKGRLQQPRMDRPSHANFRGATLALQYYLYLALAPEPERTRLRNNWRALRVKRFEDLRPPDLAGQADHLRLMNLAPVAVEPSSKQPSRLATFMDADGAAAGEVTDWARWWQFFLRHEPATYFGGLTPLTMWEESPIRKIVEAEQVKDRPMSGFGRCVDRVLDAYLHLCGVKGGLTSVKHESGNPWPKIPVEEGE